jgi:N-acetylmuramic acid 6-phosphate etherase
MDHLQTEARNPSSTNLDELPPLDVVRLMNTEDARVIPAVASQAEAIARAVEVIADRLRRGGRLVYLGAGTSGRLGVLDAAECPPTFSSPPGQVVGLIAGGPAALTQAVEGAEDHPELAERDLEAIAFGAGDVLVGIATSGRTPYVQGGIRYARRLGAYTIGFSCNPDSELLSLVDLAITPVVGPEVLTGSTRLKAGTATKLVLNLLSTGAMVCLGKTYGNLMVDLRATNSKLRARTNRIVRQLTGLTEAEAAELLQQCNGELKMALVARLANVTPEEARARLEAVRGQVRQALGRTADRKSGLAEWLAQKRNDLCLGVDGGGTHTVALLASRDGAVLGRGEAGPSNLHAVGAQRALQALDQAVAAAFAAAGLAREGCARVPVAAACLGLAGCGREEERAVIRDWATGTHLADHVQVTTDVSLLLAAGTPGGWGVAVVAGTGSIAYGRSADGREARAGGWGPLLGDEGSGYSLALRALQAVARAADGRGPATLLQERLLSQLGLERPQQLIPWLSGGGDRTAVAALAPLVLEAADAGDQVASGIAEEGARGLAFAAEAVARSLNMDTKAVPLALAGGVLLTSACYRARLLQELGTQGVVPAPVTLVPEPARGALLLASAALRTSSSPSR